MKPAQPKPALGPSSRPPVELMSRIKDECDRKLSMLGYSVEEGGSSEVADQEKIYGSIRP